jgi:signal transduction histidine kinase
VRWPAPAEAVALTRRYGLAVAAVAGAAALAAVVRPVTHAPESSLFVVAVMVSAWRGGLGPSLFATALSAAVLDASMTAGRLPSEETLGRLGVFAVVAVAVSLMSAATAAARADAEAADRAKDDFVAMVAHELRTPLTAIAGWVTALRRDALDAAQQARALAAIERNVALQARVVEDLVDLARVRRGALSLRAGEVDMEAIAEAAADAVRAIGEARRVALSVTVRPPHPCVVGDAARLQQVLTNLLVNAIRHSTPGTTVRIDVRGGAGSLRVDVQDAGCGITPELLPHVFERYRQAGDAPGNPGLGLGLAIVREIVELHGGRVEARSAGAGQGACFTVYLPATS